MTFVASTRGTDAGGTASPAETVAGNGSPSELFTTLLVAQLRNQDPLDPADPAELVSQLTQLSQMEALQRLGEQADTQSAMLESLQFISLGAQVGTQVTVSTDRVILDTEPVQGRFTLASGSAEVSVVIESATGGQKRIPLGTQPAGDVSFTIDPAELGLPPGTYSVRVETDGGVSQGVEVTGALRSVRLSPSGGLVLEVANIGAVSPTSITAFNGAPAVVN